MFYSTSVPEPTNQETKTKETVDDRIDSRRPSSLQMMIMMMIIIIIIIIIVIIMIRSYRNICVLD